MPPADFPPLDPSQRYSVREACRYLRVSRPYLYTKIRRGELRVLKDGSRTYVPGTEIARQSSIEAA